MPTGIEMGKQSMFTEQSTIMVITMNKIHLQPMIWTKYTNIMLNEWSHAQITSDFIYIIQMI